MFANSRSRTGSPNALNIPAMTSASSALRPAEVTGGQHSATEATDGDSRTARFDMRLS